MDEDGSALLDVWMSHGDKVLDLPPGFEVLASTPACPVAGMYCEVKRLYGVQFHPEVTHTLQGKRILEHFIHELCGCEALWTPRSEEHTSELQSRGQLVCRLLLETKKSTSCQRPDRNPR